MANNCCNGEKCQEIVTIEWMKKLASNGGCVDVSDAQPLDSCCQADASAYTPTYNEISAETYADMRVLSTNPNGDTNGFILLEQPQHFDGCCGDIESGYNLILKNELEFGYTEISGISLSVQGSYPSPCNPNCTVIETDTYVRYTLECDEEESSQIKVNSATTAYTSDTNVQLAKTYGKIDTSQSCSATCDVSIEGRTISTSITACNSSASDSITFPSSSYTITIGLLPYEENGVPKNIPCEGGTISGITIGGCNGDVSIDSIDIDVDGASYSEEGNNFYIQIPRNESGKSSVNIDVNFTIGGNQGKIEDCSYNWDDCEYTPVVENPCEIFWNLKESWCKRSDVEEYKCNGTKITC